MVHTNSYEKELDGQVKEKLRLKMQLPFYQKDVGAGGGILVGGGGGAQKRSSSGQFKSQSRQSINLSSVDGC